MIKLFYWSFIFTFLCVSHYAEARWYPGKFLGNRNQQRTQPSNRNSNTNNTLQSHQVQPPITEEHNTEAKQENFRLTALNSELAVTADSAKDESDTAKFRWFGSQFQYKDVNGKWGTPSASYITEKEGSFYTDDSETETVKYNDEDVLFRVGKKWYRAEKEKIVKIDRAKAIVEMARADLGLWLPGGACFAPVRKYIGGHPPESMNIGVFSRNNTSIKLAPGQIMKWHNAHFGHVHGASHWSIIESVNDNGTINIIHQNMNGSPMIRQTVNPYTMGGSFTVYQP